MIPTLPPVATPVRSKSVAATHRGLLPLVASEAFAGAVGFGVLLILARRLGPERFAAVESAAALAAVLLVAVRSGVESIVIREAARRPRLIGPLTDTLIGLKLVAAVMALGVILIAAVGSRIGFGVAIAAGLILVPSALVPDVGPRAEGQLRLLAGVQIVRSLALVVAVVGLVQDTSHAARAAACVGIAEIGAMIPLVLVHRREYRWPRIAIRPRAWKILTTRGAVASVARFGRVFLYGVDLLILGWGWTDFGPYAASRRVVFAIVALGLVVPTVLAPAVAKSWAAGVEDARRAIARGLRSLLSLALPAGIGLMLTAQGWTTILFGEHYKNGGAAALILLAARLPLLLIASFDLAALVAVRREARSLRVVAVMLLVAVATVPLAAGLYGPLGAGAAMVVVELVGVGCGWCELRRLKIQPPVLHANTATWIASAAMGVGVLAVRGQSTIAASLLGAFTYGFATLVLTWRGQR